MIKAKVSVGLGDYFSMNKHSKGRTLTSCLLLLSLQGCVPCYLLNILISSLFGLISAT